jgi:hypothetical protein
MIHADYRLHDIRMSLFRLEEHTVVLFNIHHIVADGWSMPVIVRELLAVYEALSRNSEPDLPALPIQYADFAAWQRSLCEDGKMAAQLAYWKRQLAGVAALQLPTDRPRPPVQTWNGAHHLFSIPADLRQQLEQLGRSEGATLFMILLAAFQALLHRHTGQGDVCIGTTVAGRSHPGVETSLASSPTRSSFEPISALTLPFAPCCGRCARQRSTPTLTRTFPSSRSSATSLRSVT